MTAIKHSETRTIQFEKVLTRMQQEQYARQTFELEFGELLITVRLIRSSMFDAEFEVHYIDEAYLRSTPGQVLSEQLNGIGWLVVIFLGIIGILQGFINWLL